MPIKSSLWMSPDHLILHIAASNLAWSKSSQEIANSIINLACQLNTESYDISITTIILRTNDTKSKRMWSNLSFYRFLWREERLLK